MDFLTQTINDNTLLVLMFTAQTATQFNMFNMFDNKNYIQTSCCAVGRNMEAAYDTLVIGFLKEEFYK